ncbi:Copper chaperone CopZ [Paenibacillus sp. CECT 9249]|uniref:heavy-metal-associated domain-containing protein n=1 Tax=Paenibacillus sp. CECT 9249 TaxID=2845385 RepID=UPI001E509191|nr:cation transporter [Paenibacillus sp. CECT 9249]CAH0122291.1 Copper chaperone CopZ [Paenibacillus sp. CECT 9249]
MIETSVKVEGMSCSSCIRKIEGALEAVGAEAHVNMAEGTVRVKYDESKQQLADIKEVIRNKGYNAV